MKKKLLAVLLSVGMVASMFAGCGGDGNTTNEDTNKTETTDDKEEGKEAKDLDVAVFYYSFADVYLASVRKAMDAQMKAIGIEPQNYDGNGSQTTQNEQIDTAIQTGVDLMVVNVVTSGTPDVSMQIMDKAKQAGIPIIFFNRAVEDPKAKQEGDVLGSYEQCAFVGTDAPEAGHMQGEMIGEYLVENYDAVDLNGDGKISYSMFMGELGNVEAIYRTQFAVEDANAVLKEAGKPELEFFDAANTDKYQVDQTGSWSTQAANDYMVTNLSQYNEESNNMIELVICNNDGMAEGAISALRTKGYNKDGGKVIPVFGVDATDAAKDLIAQGAMTGTIKQDAEGMAECITFLTQNVANGKDLLDGTDKYHIAETLKNKIYIPYQTYTGEK